MTMIRFIILSSFGALFISCISLDELAPPVNEPFIKLSQASSSEVPNLKKGRYLYISRCGSCHALDPVNSHSYQEWTKIIKEEGMAEKSKLNGSELNQVLLYLKKVEPISADLIKLHQSGN
jgi:hypothetical protein